MLELKREVSVILCVAVNAQIDQIAMAWCSVSRRPS